MIKNAIKYIGLCVCFFARLVQRCEFWDHDVYGEILDIDSI